MQFRGMTFNSENFFACDLHHERYRLNQTLDTSKREHVSCLAACYKLTTPATSRKSSRVPLKHAASTASSLPALDDYFAVA